mgnify:FL=1
MVGMVSYYMNYLKSQVLNNMVGENYSLERIYQCLVEEIKLGNATTEVKNTMLSNLDKAYKYTYYEMFGTDKEPLY